jgi:DNA-binding MarR family transcriptional regulator
MSESKELKIDELLRLDNQLCFRLYAASRAVVRMYRPLLDNLGITYPQYLLLLVLWQWEKEGKAEERTLKDLCSKLQLDSGTMTPLFRRLETRGLVQKMPSGRDGREYFIGLTQEGRELKAEAAEVPKALICRYGASADLEKGKQLRDLLDDLLLLVNQ